MFRRNLFVGAVFMVFLFLGTLLRVAGFRTYALVSNSMAPRCPVTSLVLARQAVIQSQLKVGDVITFIAPTPQRQIVTHRISAISGVFPAQAIVSKGDHNPNGDPWILTPGAVLGKVVVCIPGVGAGAYIQQSRIGFLVFATTSTLTLGLFVYHLTKKEPNETTRKETAHFSG